MSASEVFQLFDGVTFWICSSILHEQPAAVRLVFCIGCKNFGWRQGSLSGRCVSQQFFHGVRNISNSYRESAYIWQIHPKRRTTWDVSTARSQSKSAASTSAALAWPVRPHSSPSRPSPAARKAASRSALALRSFFAPSTEVNEVSLAWG